MANEGKIENIQKNENDSIFEYDSFSWHIIPNEAAYKRMDKSSFLHRGTGIPIEIRNFFHINSMKVGERRDIILSQGFTEYDAHFEMINEKNPRTRLIWESDFQKFIQRKYPKWVDFFETHVKHDNTTPILILQQTGSIEKYIVKFTDGTSQFVVENYAKQSNSHEIKDVISQERERRIRLWNQLLEQNNARDLSAEILRKEYPIYNGAAGIWYDKDRTTELTGDRIGLTISVLHTGKSYPDDLGENSLVYHYPKTHRYGNMDKNEIEATKNTYKFNLPIFIITHSELNDKRRDVRLGYVTKWDDDSQIFFIEFSLHGERKIPTPPSVNEPPFQLTQKITKKERKSRQADRDPEFRFNVLSRYGPRCAVCSLEIKNLLSAAHIKPRNLGGTNDERNGLILCHNHHDAFDDFLFCVNPETMKIVYWPKGHSMTELKIEMDQLAPKRNMPHTAALQWRYEEFLKKIGKPFGSSPHGEGQSFDEC
jgi:putative restriction endonuclease